MILRSAGVTYGPTFSKEISLAAAEFTAGFRAQCGRRLKVQGKDARKLFCGILKAARTTGADIKKWFRIRAFYTVAGCLSEAIFSNRDFGELFWQDYSAEGDQGDIARDAHMAAIPISEAIAVITHMVAVNAYLMQNDAIWAAVLGLAKQLTIAGRMTGRKP